MADEKNGGNPQPQSGASGDEKKDHFRTLPEDRNKKEEGQKRWSLAPLLHWAVDRKAPPSKDARNIDSVDAVDGD
jgi:hypothetical protein